MGRRISNAPDVPLLPLLLWLFYVGIALARPGRANDTLPRSSSISMAYYDGGGGSVEGTFLLINDSALCLVWLWSIACPGWIIILRTSSAAHAPVDGIYYFGARQWYNNHPLIRTRIGNGWWCGGGCHGLVLVWA